MADPQAVRAQYATERHLLTRRSVWRAAADGREPTTLALAVVRALAPRDVLEIGCGTGAFAEPTAGRGIEAWVAEAGDLPFEDAPSRSSAARNGEEALRRHFGSVSREDLRPRAVFTDHAEALAYLSSSQEGVVWDLPAFEGPRQHLGEVTVFVAG